MFNENVLTDELTIVDERLAWCEAAETLQKPLLQRTDEEISRVITLLGRLSYASSNNMTFQTKIALSKVLRMIRCDTGTVLLTKGEDPAYEVVEGTITEEERKARRAAAYIDAGLERGGFKQPAEAGPKPNTGETPKRETGPAHPKEFFILVKGTAVIERVTVNGRVRTAIPKGACLCDGQTYAALPPHTHIIAIEPCELLVLPWDQYEMLLAGEYEEAEVQRRINFFQHELIVPVFANMQPEKLRQLALACYEVRLQTKELAVREYEAADAMFFIRSGKLKVVRAIDFTAHASSPSVKLLDMATLEPGEYFGEVALLRRRVDAQNTVQVEELLTINKDDLDAPDDEREVFQIDGAIPSIRRQATVYAHTPATLLVLPRHRFISLVQHSALVRMREYAKGYPTTAQIRSYFLKQQQWSEFKTKVFDSVADKTTKK